MLVVKRGERERDVIVSRILLMIVMRVSVVLIVMMLLNMVTNYPTIHMEREKFSNMNNKNIEKQQ